MENSDCNNILPRMVIIDKTYSLRVAFHMKKYIFIFRYIIIGYSRFVSLL